MCTHRRENLFCTDNMQLNEIGEIVRNELLRTEQMRPEVIIDEFVVMPNHLHGIILIQDGDAGVSRNFVAAHRVRPCSAPGLPTKRPYGRAPQHRTSGTLGSIIAGFKSATTRRINNFLRTSDYPIWQRNYYEHVIRSEQDLDRIRQYIRDNPARWVNDPENPNMVGKPYALPWDEESY